MNHAFRILALSLCLSLATGCASDGKSWNPFSSSEEEEYVETAPYYFSEFSDVPIPNEMNEETKETFISFAPTGIKIGVQRFTGRQDPVALMNALRGNMASNGWTLRSLLRAKKSVLIFEKQNRICSMIITEGVIYTSLQVFVSSRLEGDSAGVDMGAYTPGPSPAGKSDGTTRLTE